MFVIASFLLDAAVLNYEEDVAIYTIRAATDPRVEKRVIIYRPPKNIVSQLDLISSWEKKTGRTMKITHLPEEEVVKLTESKNTIFIFFFSRKNPLKCDKI